MIQDIGNRNFDNQYMDRPAQGSDKAFIFCGHGKADDRIFLLEGNRIPTVGQIQELESILEIVPGNFRYLFHIDEDYYYLYEEADVLSTRAYSVSAFTKYLEEEVFTKAISDADLSFSFQKVVVLRSFAPMDVCLAGMTAYHLFCWYRDSLCCGRCGGRTFHHDKMRAVKCTECGNLIFPRILPAVIIGVKNKDSLLMSQYAGREYKGRALLAGFVEIGETPEQTVAREVYEEVGLKVKNVRYYGSQPWGYDMDLLLGYFAELDGDDKITLDEEELAKAAFFKREDIEKADDIRSLTSDMIEAFRSGKEK